jgi:hypothetical protein
MPAHLRLTGGTAHEFDRDVHRRVRGRFGRCLVHCDSLLVQLVLVVLQHAADAFSVPTFRKGRLPHFFLRRRRRSAFSAFGPTSCAVITNPESGCGSGT